MMSNSELAVYSIITNINYFINNINEDVDLFKYQSYKRFERTAKYIKIYCEKIYNDIENNYYDHRFLIMFCLWQVILYDKYDIRKITKDNMKRFKYLFTNQQFNNDKKYIQNIENQLQLGDFNQYFKINNNGESIIYKLLRENKISMMIYLKYYNKLLTNPNDYNIFKTVEYMTFEKIIHKIYKLIKGV